MPKVQKFEICFSNAVENPKIAELEEVDPFTEKILYPIFTTIFKDNKHPSPITINSVTSGSTFQFSCVIVNDVFKEIKKLMESLPAC